MDDTFDDGVDTAPVGTIDGVAFSGSLHLFVEGLLYPSLVVLRQGALVALRFVYSGQVHGCQGAVDGEHVPARYISREPAMPFTSSRVISEDVGSSTG